MMRRLHDPSAGARARRLRHAAALLVLLAAAGCAGRPASPPSPRSGEPVTVIVQRGDTLLGIARRHGVGLGPIAAANGLSPPYLIRPGQVLHVPGAERPPPALAAAPALPPPVPPAGVAAPLAAPLPSPAGAEERAVTAEALPPPPGPAAGQPGSQAAAPLREAPMPAAPVTARAPDPEPAPAARRAAEPPPRRLPPGRFAWPVRGEVVSAFGAKGGGMVNDGLNIAAPRGTPVRAAADGVVIYAGNEVRGFGNLLLVRHDGGWVTAYGHADRLLVRQGQRVTLGQEIARVGSSGAVTTPQLHFQVRRNGRPVDPSAHLERRMAGL